MLKDPRGIGDVEEPCEVETELSDLLKSLGFDPGIPIYRARPTDEFSRFMECIKNELFHPAYHPPNWLTFKRRDRRLGGWGLEVAIELLRPIWKPYRITPAGPVPTDPGCPFGPDRYLRGLICAGPLLGPYKIVGRIHLYVPTDNLGVAHDWPDGVITQVVTEPSDSDPDTQLMWGIGLPDRLLGL